MSTPTSMGTTDNGQGGHGQHPLLASELFALCRSTKCSGTLECHWCGAPCERMWLHDDDPPIVGVRRTIYARRPGNPYVCVGCWMWRYKAVTVRLLKEGFLDGQQMKKHSWWITDEGCWALKEEDDFEELRKELLDPPERFCLAFLDNTKIDNLLQLMVVNDNKSSVAETPLWFTVDGVKESYSIYELEEAILSGEANGKSAGTRYLIQKLKWPPRAPKEKKGPGRPPNDPKKDPQRAIRGKPPTFMDDLES